MFDQSGMTYLPMGGGYGYFNYAVLHGTGLSHVLDTMRYERAFFARASDVTQMIEAAASYPEWVTRRYAILLGKYDFQGKTKPTWTPARLLSDQELEIITDPMQLMQLSSDELVLRPAKKLKLQHILALEGSVEWLLRVMHLNRAMPFEEGDARQLERAFFEGTPTKVTLTNFCVSKTMWTFPATVKK